MQPITKDISCIGYAVKADIYEGSSEGPLLLSLIGRTSKRTKQRYYDFLPRLSENLGVTSVIFDYTGHGDSPFDYGDLTPAQHFLEVITVFDWMKEKYPNRKIFVIGSSYGGFLATQLTKYRKFDGLILRAPAMYRPADFYTRAKDEDKAATMMFRGNSELLATHPLLTRASKYEGKTLLVVHENDELIPTETTDAYEKALSPDVYVAKGVSHSLDQATPEQVSEYNDAVINWIKKQI